VQPSPGPLHLHGLDPSPNLRVWSVLFEPSNEVGRLGSAADSIADMNTSVGSPYLMIVRFVLLRLCGFALLLQRFGAAGRKLLITQSLTLVCRRTELFHEACLIVIVCFV